MNFVSCFKKWFSFSQVYCISHPAGQPVSHLTLNVFLSMAVKYPLVTSLLVMHLLQCFLLESKMDIRQTYISGSLSSKNNHFSLFFYQKMLTLQHFLCAHYQKNLSYDLISFCFIQYVLGKQKPAVFCMFFFCLTSILF